MFKPFQIPYQLPISDLPQVIAANNIRETNTFMLWCIYFFYNFVSSGWTNISLEGHWHFFCSQSTSPATWSWGGFGMWTGTSQVVGHAYIQKDIVLILTKGGKGSQAALDRVRLREEMSLKCQQVITYCVVASVQVPMIAWPINFISNLKTFSQSVSSVSDKQYRS